MRSLTTWLRMIGAALLALALLAPSGAALAAEPAASGTLQARGSGYARLEGSGTVTIARGAGTVWVTGDAEISASGKGRRTTLPDGTVRLTGYSGVITITGEDVVVRISGRTIGFTATGDGSALLKGVGQYTAGDASGKWTKDGVTVGY